jgi:hypothetical protein
MVRTTRHWGVSLIVLAALGTARADSYYMVVFGAQSMPQLPRYSHSWATFVRIPGDCGCGPPVQPAPVEWFTISWLPTKVELTPNNPFSEPGRNFGLAETFDAVLSHCERVMAFGPYQIDGWLYCRALEQKNHLESGEERYKTIDWFRNPHRTSNCIHALTSFDPEHKRVRIGRLNLGQVASYYVTDTYRPHIVCPHKIHCWIADLLGLGQYPIKWWTLDEGRPNPRRDG